MAFTDQERADIRLFLGWPAAFYAASDRLEQAMDNISADRPNDEINARTILGQVATLDTAITDRLLVSTWATKTGSIQQRAEYAQEALNRRGRILCSRLAGIFGLVIQRDFFGTREPPYVDDRQGAPVYYLAEG